MVECKEQWIRIRKEIHRHHFIKEIRKTVFIIQYGSARAFICYLYL